MRWTLTTDIFQVHFKWCYLEKKKLNLHLFPCLSQRSKYGFPFLLSSPGTTPFICFHINPVYLVFACLHGTLTDIDLSVVLSLDWPKDCGLAHFKPNTVERIVSGNEARPHSWPWQVSLQVNYTWNDTQGVTKEEVTDACIYFNRFVPEAVNIMFMCVEGLWSIRTGFLLLPTASRSKAKHKFITCRAELRPLLEFCAGQLSWLISPDGAPAQESLDAH